MLAILLVVAQVTLGASALSTFRPDLSLERFSKRIESALLFVSKAAAPIPSQCNSQCGAIENVFSSCSNDTCFCTSGNMNNLRTCLQCVVDIQNNLAAEQTLLSQTVNDCNSQGHSVPTPASLTAAAAPSPSSAGGGGSSSTPGGGSPGGPPSITVSPPASSQGGSPTISSGGGSGPGPASVSSSLSLPPAPTGSGSASGASVSASGSGSVNASSGVSSILSTGSPTTLSIPTSATPTSPAGSSTGTAPASSSSSSASKMSTVPPGLFASAFGMVFALVAGVV